MKVLILVSALIFTLSAKAEQATCTVKGMHCTGCKEMVEGKLCDEKKFSKCEVKIVDEKKEIGQLELTTKEANAKVDQKAVGAVIEDAGYKLEKCTVKKVSESKKSA